MRNELKEYTTLLRRVEVVNWLRKKQMVNARKTMFNFFFLFIGSINLTNQISILGGKEGINFLDKNGNVFWHFNSHVMFKSCKKSSGENIVEMFEQNK